MDNEVDPSLSYHEKVSRGTTRLKSLVSPQTRLLFSSSSVVGRLCDCGKSTIKYAFEQWLAWLGEESMIDFFWNDEATEFGNALLAVKNRSHSVEKTMSEVPEVGFSVWFEDRGVQADLNFKDEEMRGYEKKLSDYEEKIVSHEEKLKDYETQILLMGKKMKVLEAKNDELMDAQNKLIILLHGMSPGKWQTETDLPHKTHSRRDIDMECRLEKVEYHLNRLESDRQLHTQKEQNEMSKLKEELIGKFGNLMEEKELQKMHVSYLNRMCNKLEEKIQLLETQPLRPRSHSCQAPLVTPLSMPLQTTTPINLNANLTNPPLNKLGMSQNVVYNIPPNICANPNIVPLPPNMQGGFPVSIPAKKQYLSEQPKNKPVLDVADVTSKLMSTIASSSTVDSTPNNFEFSSPTIEKGRDLLERSKDIFNECKKLDQSEKIESFIKDIRAHVDITNIKLTKQKAELRQLHGEVESIKKNKRYVEGDKVSLEMGECI